MSQCIPILYYGTEQGFNGGDDPNNRESLWPYMNRSHELYIFIKHLLQIRKNLTNNWLKKHQIERFTSSKVYAFSRGDVVIVVTTEPITMTAKIVSHPYKSGQVLQNLLNGTQVFKVSSKRELKIVLKDGEPLILAVVSSVGVRVLPLGLPYLSIVVIFLTFCKYA